MLFCSFAGGTFPWFDFETSGTILPFTLDVLFKSDSSLLSSFLQVFADCTEVVIFILTAGTTGHNFSFPPFEECCCFDSILLLSGLMELLVGCFLGEFFLLACPTSCLFSTLDRGTVSNSERLPSVSSSL